MPNSLHSKTKQSGFRKSSQFNGFRRTDFGRCVTFMIFTVRIVNKLFGITLPKVTQMERWRKREEREAEIEKI